MPPHHRSSPDGDFYDNWSTSGNVNPYTGKEGTKTIPPQSEMYLPYSGPHLSAPTSALPATVSRHEPSVGSSADTYSDSSPNAASLRDSRSQLGQEERQSLELACVTAKMNGPSSYDSCLSGQMRRLDVGARRI